MAVSKLSLSKGRPRKCTEECIETITKSVRRGDTFVVACQLAGINEYTRMGWMRTARRLIEENVADPEVALGYPEVQLFYKTIQAEADYKSYLLGKVKKKTSRDWKAAAWLLETRWPKEFGRGTVSRLEVTGADGEPIKQEVKLVIEPDQVKQVLTILANAGAIRMGQLKRAVLEVDTVYPAQPDAQAISLPTP